MNNIAEQHKNGMDSEEITLYTAAPVHEEDEQNPDAQVATLKFTQLDKQRSLGKKLVLYDNKQLSVSNYALKSKDQYWLNLGFVNAKAEQKWLIAWSWLGSTLTASAFAALSAAIAVKPLLGIDKWTAIGVSLLFVGICVLSAFALFRKSRRVLNFYSLNGKAKVMELLFNNPSRDAYNQFTKTLVQKIQLAQQKQHLGKKETLAAELAMHRQLMQNNIITAEQYEAAKKRLFSMH